MSAHVWGAHASSRAGDDIPVIADFFSSRASAFAVTEDRFGEDAETSTRVARAPRTVVVTSSHLLK